MRSDSASPIVITGLTPVIAKEIRINHHPYLCPTKVCASIVPPFTAEIFKFIEGLRDRER
jgi:hypothetical protein